MCHAWCLWAHYSIYNVRWLLVQCTLLSKIDNVQYSLKLKICVNILTIIYLTNSKKKLPNHNLTLCSICDVIENKNVIPIKNIWWLKKSIYVANFKAHLPNPSAKQLMIHLWMKKTKRENFFPTLIKIQKFRKEIFHALSSHVFDVTHNAFFSLKFQFHW